MYGIGVVKHEMFNEVGDFVKNEITSKNAKLLFDDGSLYEGEVVKG